MTPTQTDLDKARTDLVNRSYVASWLRRMGNVNVSAISRTENLVYRVMMRRKYGDRFYTHYDEQILRDVRIR